MNSTFCSVLTEVHALAEQRGWTDVVELTTGLLLNRAASTVLVAAPAGVDTGSFRRWLMEIAPDLALTERPLEGLAQDVRTAMQVDKLIAVFECGRLLEASSMDAIAHAFFCRPAASYAMVLGGAQRLAEAEELDLVERGAWRLLVPDPKVDWSHQDLLESRCYLWEDREPPPFLQQRLQRDMQAFTTWLRDPRAPEDELARQQVLYAIALAEEQSHRSEASTPRESPPSSQRILLELETLTHFRQHVLRWLDAEQASIERALTASLQTLEQDLLHQVRPFLQERLPQLGSSLEGDRVRMLIGDYITAGLTRWRHQAEGLLTSRGRETLADIHGSLQGMDWSLINEVAARHGLPGPYPDALMQELLFRPGIDSIDVREVMGDDSPSHQQGLSTLSVIRATLGASIVAATAMALHLGPTAAVAGGVLGVVGAEMMNRAIRHGQSLKECEAYARSAIRAVIRQALSHAQEQTRQTVGQLRTRLSEQCKALEAILDRLLVEVHPPADTRTLAHPDREVLDSLRQTVLATIAPKC